MGLHNTAAPLGAFALTFLLGMALSLLAIACSHILFLDITHPIFFHLLDLLLQLPNKH